MDNMENKAKPIGYGNSFDLYSTVKDILRRWHLILLASILGAMGCFVYSTETYKPRYYTVTTMLVQSKTTSTSSSVNLSSATKLAEIVKTVIESDQFKKTVAEDMGCKEFPGELTCSLIEETNIISFTVVSDTPMKSYNLLKAVLDNYPTFTKVVASNVVLQTLEDPVVPATPLNGKSSMSMMVVGFFGAGVLTALLFGVLSYFKDTIKKESDVEKKLNIKRIVSVPRQSKKLTIKEKLKGVKKSLSLANPVISFEFREAFKKIRRFIVNDYKNHNHKLFTITSSLENEGKTTIAVNIAISLAKLDCKVLLVDADLRKPAIAKFLDMNIEEGKSLIDFLNGKARISDITYYNDLLNLSIIGCNKGTIKANELVSSEEMKYLLETAKENYDYVIVDTAPLGFASDAEDVMTQTDSTVLVVRRDIATAITINDTIELILNTDSKILGCVYNDSETSTLTGSKLAYNRYGYGDYGYGYKKYKTGK